MNVGSVDLAVIQRAVLRSTDHTTGDHTAVGDECQHIVGAVHAQVAVLNGHIFHKGVFGVADQDTAQQVSIQMGIVNGKIFDGSSIRMGKQSCVHLRYDSRLKGQAGNGVSLSIESSLEIAVVVAEVQRFVLQRSQILLGNCDVIHQQESYPITVRVLAHCRIVAEVLKVSDFIGLSLCHGNLSHCGYQSYQKNYRQQQGQNTVMQLHDVTPPSSAGQPSACHTVSPLFSLCTPSAWMCRVN